MFRPRAGRHRGLSINRFIPNILTMSALCAGLTALRFGIEGRFEPAVVCLVIAAVFDMLDGRIARMLGQSSRFGAELDSLSDFLCFGIAPATLLYLWSLQHVGPVGWVVALFFAVCCALRLARFNTDIDAPQMPPWAKNYFTGVPSPAGANLVLSTLILSFQVDWPWLREPVLVAAIMIVVGALLVSRVPTYSFKNLRIPHRSALFVMLGVALIAALVVVAPWSTLTLITVVYVVLMPFGLRSFRRLKREAAGYQASPPAPAA